MFGRQQTCVCAFTKCAICRYENRFLFLHCNTGRSSALLGSSRKKTLYSSAVILDFMCVTYDVLYVDLDSDLSRGVRLEPYKDSSYSGDPNTGVFFHRYSNMDTVQVLNGLNDALLYPYNELQNESKTHMSYKSE